MTALRANIYKFLILLLSIIATINTSLAQSKSDNNPTIVEKITVDQADGLTLISVVFDKVPPYKKLFLQEHGNFIQIAFPNTLIADPGNFVDGKGPFVTKIGAYQVGENRSMVRLFVKGKALDVLKASVVELLGNRAVVTVRHKNIAVPSLSQQEPAPISPSVTLPNEPASQTKALAASSPIVSRSRWQIGKTIGALSWTQLSALSLVAMLVILFSVVTLRKIARNKRFYEDAKSPIKMRAVSHLSLAPRQKVSLVEVGGEKILLSVSPDNISFLARLGSSEPTAQTTVQPAIQTMPNDYINRTVVLQKEAQRSIKSKKNPLRLESNSSSLPVKTKKQVQSENNRKKQHPKKPSTQTSSVKIAPKKQQAPARRTTTNSVTKKSVNLSKKPQKDQHKGIQVRIDDSGITDENRIGPQKSQTSFDDSVSDVTEMIRERLKSLPKL